MIEVNEIEKKLIDTALHGKHREPELITSMISLLVAAKLLAAEKSLLIGLRRASKDTYTKYLTMLKSGVDNVQLLIDHRTFQQCLDFYNEDYKIIRHAINEYIVYLANGRFLAALFGECRPETEMFDFLTGKKFEVATNE